MSEELRKLKGKTVLITGAGGFIGSNLYRSLLMGGISVHGVVLPRSSRWRLKSANIQGTIHARDLLNSDALTSICGDIRPDVIIHCAAAGVIHDAEADPAILWTNLQITDNLLTAAKKCRATRVVYLASSTEYRPGNRALDEGSPLGPVSRFAVSKTAATLLALQRSAAENIPTVVLRPFSTYGYFESHKRLIPTVILALLHSREIYITSADSRRDLTFIEDLVTACVKAATTEDVECETINIGTGRHWTNRQVVDTQFTVAGDRVPVHEGAYPHRPHDRDCWMADNRKARRLLGWKPCHDLEQGMRKSFSWFCENIGYYQSFSEDGTVDKS